MGLLNKLFGDKSKRQQPVAEPEIDCVSVIFFREYRGGAIRCFSDDVFCEKRTEAFVSQLTRYIQQHYGFVVPISYGGRGQGQRFSTPNEATICMPQAGADYDLSAYDIPSDVFVGAVMQAAKSCGGGVKVRGNIDRSYLPQCEQAAYDYFSARQPGQSPQPL